MWCSQVSKKYTVFVRNRKNVEKSEQTFKKIKITPNVAKVENFYLLTKWLRVFDQGFGVAWLRAKCEIMRLLVNF